jgi:hypothetical protein
MTIWEIILWVLNGGDNSETDGRAEIDPDG